MHEEGTRLLTRTADHIHDSSHLCRRYLHKSGVKYHKPIRSNRRLINTGSHGCKMQYNRKGHPMVVHIA